MNAISTPSAIDSLIESCKTYLNLVNYKSRPTAFIEWVIQLASGQGKPSTERIESKFLTARIWGNDEVLNDIKTQLNTILNPESTSVPIQFVESVASVNGYLITVSSTDNSGNSCHVYSIDGFFVTITLPLTTINYNKIAKRIPELSIVSARNVANILREILGLRDQIFDHIPVDQLIHLGINDLSTIHLWKGSEGVLISSIYKRSTCVGRLSNDCRTVTSTPAPCTHLTLCNVERENTIKYSNLLSVYTNNADNYSRLMELVRANVSNPDAFNKTPLKIEYTVRVDVTDHVDNQFCHSLSLGYMHRLIVTPQINNDDQFYAIMNEVKNKDQSHLSLIKKVEEILNS